MGYSQEKIGKGVFKKPLRVLLYILYTKNIYIFINWVIKSQIFRVNILKIVTNIMLNSLKLLKAKILRALCLTPLDFFIAYKFKLKINKKLVKKQRLVYYLS